MCCGSDLQARDEGLGEALRGGREHTAPARANARWHRADGHDVNEARREARAAHVQTASGAGVAHMRFVMANVPCAACRLDSAQFETHNLNVYMSCECAAHSVSQVPACLTSMCLAAWARPFITV